MIGSITGQLLHQNQASALLETASGVGYRVFCGQLQAQVGDTIRLYTYHHVREDADDLYGFERLEDLETFELLLTVSGVGPKMALGIQASLGRQTIIDAVVNNQPALFKSVSGVGQKVAEKIIVELKSKVGGLATTSLAGQESSEVFEALLGLGYRQPEIVAAMKEIDASLPAPEKIKQALRLLSH